MLETQSACIRGPRQVKNRKDCELEKKLPHEVKALKALLLTFLNLFGICLESV